MTPIRALFHRRHLALASIVVAASAFLVFGLHSSAYAQPGDTAIKWIAVGPDGPNIGSGKVNAFAYFPSNPKIMYFGGGWGNTPRESPSQSGVFGTTDGGTHWTALDNGLTNPDGTFSSVINGLWMDPNHSSTLLAATEFGGTFRTSDGGTTWHNVDRNESTQFAQESKNLYVATRAGVLLSTDDGRTFHTSLADKTGASTVATASGSTYAGTMGGDVFRLQHVDEGGAPRHRSRPQHRHRSVQSEHRLCECRRRGRMESGPLRVDRRRQEVDLYQLQLLDRRAGDRVQPRREGPALLR
jgi:hypothetical protein